MWSCSRYVFNPPPPKKGTYANVKVSEFSDIISIDPDDTEIFAKRKFYNYRDKRRKRIL